MYKVIYKTNIIYQEKRVKSRGSRYLEVGVEGGGRSVGPVFKHLCLNLTCYLHSVTGFLVNNRYVGPSEHAH